MARQVQKRKHLDDRSRSDVELATKKTKTQSQAEREAWRSWKYPPEFWDRLSKISLTTEAIEEHNRRIRLQRRRCPSLSVPSQRGRAGLVAHPLPAQEDLARFARHGGPDLSDLRGHPHQAVIAMSASQSSRNRTASIDPTSTLPASVPTKTKTRKSTPYNGDFEQHLVDHDIHTRFTSKTPDLTEVQEALLCPRRSLSSMNFSEGAFKRFQESDVQAKDESDVVANVLPTILGSDNPAHASARNTAFKNLDPLTDGTIAPAMPDIYYGSDPAELSPSVRGKIGNHIIPSTMLDKPLAPNFFVEVKGPNGTPAVASRQIRYDGAVGSRAMQSLQNYGEKEPKHDGRPYTFSSTYHGGTGLLQLYAHHTTVPTSGGEPEYYITKLHGFDMTDTRETFVQGATAFRNLRDLAKVYRDRFIHAANSVSQSKTPVLQDIDDIDDIEAQQENPATDYFTWQNCDDLQQSIANDAGYDSQDNAQTQTAASPQGSHKGDAEGPSQDSVAFRVDPSLAVTSSFTSIVNIVKWPWRKWMHSPAQGANSGTR